MAKKNGSKGAKGAKGEAESTPVPPKIHPKNRNKNKNKNSWNLPALPILAVAAVVAHFAYLLMTNGSEAVVDTALATDLVYQGMRKVHSNHLLEGLQLLEQSIEVDPNAPQGYNSKAGVLRMLGRNHEALEILKQGDEMVTKHHGATHRDLYFIKQGLFHLYNDFNQNKKAVESIQMAIELEPKAEFYVLWAGMHSGVDDSKKAELYNKALELDPTNIPAFCLRYHTHALLGKWERMDEEHSQLLQNMNSVMKHEKRTDISCLQPYHISYMNFTAEMMRDTAKMFAMREARASEGDVLPALLPSQVEPQFGADRKRSRKLRIGYVSSDLQSHPVGRNVLGLMMAHNKKKYEVFCFSAKHVDDAITTAIMNTINYVDLTKFNMSHTGIAKMIREEYKIDVLIDLNGWTSGRRLQIFSAKPAPVQITHGLGFVGTTGVDAFQYFISDGVATPARFDHLYTEKVVRLPNAYLPASHMKVHITEQGQGFDPGSADKMALRKENDLPEDEDVFVYCSFQSMHKISPEAFDAWMRILQSSPNSVLWMTTVGGHNHNQLLKWAKEKHQIGTERFVFSGSKQVGQHLIRAQACDLHLDSWPYNAHSTATDVLWAGVPLLVYLPDYHDPSAATQSPKMCSRVSASLLHTLGMPQLIVSTIEQFEDEAVRLSNDRKAYEKLRNELIQKRLSSPLYDLIAYARNHEMVYAELFERFLRGEEPSVLNIP